MCYFDHSFFVGSTNLLILLSLQSPLVKVFYLPCLFLLLYITKSIPPVVQRTTSIQFVSRRFLVVSGLVGLTIANC